MLTALQLVLLTCLSYVVQASSVLTPPVLPLVVRSPYLSAWLPSARNAPWERWPMFYTGADLGLSIMASVGKNKDRTIYPLLGRPQDALVSDDRQSFKVAFPKYNGVTYDASSTSLSYNIPSAAGAKSREPVEIIVSFLCPITPTSTLRQALPACYLEIAAQGSFDVDLYVDVNGQWVTGQLDAQIEWSLAQTDAKNGIKTWKVKRTNELLFTETADRAEWGTLYFSGPSNVKHEAGSSRLLRRGFASNGTLNNIVDSRFRPVADQDPAFAFSKTFNLSSSAGARSDRGGASSHVIFSIAHIQDPVVQYAAPQGLTLMRPLWKSWFTQDAELVQYHYKDYSAALTLARNYSEQLSVDAFKSGSTNYVDIVALSARQIMGATTFSGTPESPLLFLKEISSNGNSQTVDVIFPAAPFFLYTNPRWLAYLLEPLLEHQLSGLYPNKYSMHDMGTHFPNITGHADGRDEYMPLEECGNMLIMGLAMANSLRFSSSNASTSPWVMEAAANATLPTSESTFPLQSLGSRDGIDKLDYSWSGANGQRQATKWLNRSYPLWKQWTGYLVDFSLEPHNQLSTDDFAGWLALQTNIALKGIVGIKAMSEIASLVGHSDDARKYTDISASYIQKWQEYAISRDGSHAKLAYNWYGSWTTLYSLYADALLCFHPTITNNPLVTSDGADTQQQQPPPPTQPREPAVMQAPNGAVQVPLAPPSPVPSAGAAAAAQAAQSSSPNSPPAHAAEAPTPIGPLSSSSSSSSSSSTHHTDFIPHSIYTNQSAFYRLAMQKYGLPLDSRHLYTKSDWQFQAAAVAAPGVRKQILDRVALWVNETSTDRPLTDLYLTEGDGGFPEGLYFMARPVVGGHFAFLALERACGS